MSSPGVATAYRRELRKLRSQKRTYMGFAIAIAIPLIFVIALALQNGQPEGILFGRYVRQSGFAIPLVVLIFGSIWLFPLVTSLVAGDIFASEDHNGTLKTILTRSLDRGQIFTGKVLAAVSYAAVALVLQIGSIIPGLEEIRPYLLPRQFDAWQGLLREPTDWAPIGRAAWVCAAYAVPSLFAALVVFLRRDVTGG